MDWESCPWRNMKKIWELRRKKKRTSSTAQTPTKEYSARKDACQKTGIGRPKNSSRQKGGESSALPWSSHHVPQRSRLVEPRTASKCWTRVSLRSLQLTRLPSQPGATAIRNAQRTSMLPCRNRSRGPGPGERRQPTKGAKDQAQGFSLRTAGSIYLLLNASEF